MLKIWVDDERNPPSLDWVVCRTFQSAYDLISRLVGDFEISLDHDLGDENPRHTGYDLACRLESLVFQKLNLKPVIYCHSQNPVGRQKIEGIIRLLMEKL